MATSTHPAGFDGAPTTNADRTLSRHRLWLLVMSMLGCSLLLQLVAMSAPGWYIFDRFKIGLFYSVECRDDEPCTVTSFWDEYMDDIKGASELERLEERLKFSLNAARLCTGAVLAFVCTLASFFALIRCRNAKTKTILYASCILIPTLSVTGFIMGQSLYEAFVKWDYFVNVFALADVDIELGFPYCVLCYSIACIQLFVSVFGLSKTFHDRLTDNDQ